MHYMVGNTLFHVCSTWHILLSGLCFNKCSWWVFKRNVYLSKSQT